MPGFTGVANKWNVGSSHLAGLASETKCPALALRIGAPNIHIADPRIACDERGGTLPSQAPSARLGHRKVILMSKARLRNLQKKIREAERLLANVPADERPAAERLIAILREEIEVLRLLIGPLRPTE